MFVVTESDVVWTDDANQIVGRHRLSDGGQTEEALPGAYALGLDDSGVYAGGFYGLERLPIDSGVPVISGCGARALALAGDRIYWTTQGSSCVGIRFARKDGSGPLTAIASFVDAGTPQDIAISDTTVAVTVRPDLNHAPGLVAVFPIDGGAPLNMPGQGSPRGIVSSGSGFFWVNAGTPTSGNIMPHTGAILAYSPGAAVRTIVAGLEEPADLVVDGEDIYFVTSGTAPSFRDGTVERIGRDGTRRKTLFTGQWHPTRIFLRGPYLYWMNNANFTAPNGAILRVAK